MFTGIVEEIGAVAGKLKVSEGNKLTIRSRKVLRKLSVSDSVAVNGVCLTVTKKSKKDFEVTAVHETLKKTTLGSLIPGNEVNLESSLKIGGDIGGHFVFGHIDDAGIISSIKKVKPKGAGSNKSNNYEFRIRVKSKYRKYVIPAGSIAMNGVSLTIAKIFPSSKASKYIEIKAAIIPYTYKNTTFKNLSVKDKVNIEFDFLGKYVLNILEKKKF